MDELIRFKLNILLPHPSWIDLQALCEALLEVFLNVVLEVILEVVLEVVYDVVLLFCSGKFMLT